jgi:hypothetical protein
MIASGNDSTRAAAHLMNGGIGGNTRKLRVPEATAKILRLSAHEEPR